MKMPAAKMAAKQADNLANPPETEAEGPTDRAEIHPTAMGIPAEMAVTQAATVAIPVATVAAKVGKTNDPLGRI